MAGKTPQRCRYTADFKARVARDAMREVNTLSAVAARHGIHPNQVRDWRRLSNRYAKWPNREPSTKSANPPTTRRISSTSRLAPASKSYDCLYGYCFSDLKSYDCLS